MKRLPFLKRAARAVRYAAFVAGHTMRGTPVEKRNAFAGAASNRLLFDWIASSRSPDEEIRGETRVLRSRARELARNNSYIRRYVRLLLANVIGYAGIKLQALIRTPDGELDTATNQIIEDGWKDFAAGPVSIDGKYGLRRFEEMILRTLAIDGEAFVRIWRGSEVNRYGLAFQPIDADMIDERFSRGATASTNEIRLGVEVDKVGRPVGYWVWDKPGALWGAAAALRKRYFVPAEDMIHLYNPERVNQTRGVTWLHSIMVPVHMLDGYEESEAVASRVTSAKMGFLVKTAPEVGGSLSLTGDEGTDPKPAQMQASPGSFEVLDDGYDFKPWDPVHPTSQFGSFINQMVRKIASGLSVFSNVLGNDAAGVNYSSMRSFSQIERDDWRQIQGDLIDLWRRPIYTEWIRLSLLTGAVRLPSRDPSKYTNVRHRPRGWAWIDPQKEAQAAVLAIDNQLASRTSILAEKGIDIEDVFAEIKAERVLAESYGVKLESVAPAPPPAVTIEDVEDAVEDAGGNGATDDDRASLEELAAATRVPGKIVAIQIPD